MEAATPVRQNPQFRIFRGRRWWYPVVWLEQVGGRRVLAQRVPFPAVEDALREAWRLSRGAGWQVTVEWQGGVRDAFAFGPPQGS